MNPTATGATVFACTLVGMLLGMWLRDRLPKHHLNVDSERSFKEVNGLLSTMTALILGLVTASAQEAFSKIGDAVQHTAADVIALDRMLARYGPETAPIRTSLRRVVLLRMEQIWPGEQHERIISGDTRSAQEVEHLGALISTLEPKLGNQKWLKARALELTESLLAARWGIDAGHGAAIPPVFLILIVFWLTIAFVGYALFAPRNRTIVGVLVVGAFSVASVIFLILELSGPFEGLISVSSDPLRFALAHLGE